MKIIARRKSRNRYIVIAFLVLLCIYCGCGGGSIKKVIDPSVASVSKSVCRGKPPDLSSIVAVGASYTAGMQNACMHDPMQMNSPVAQLSRQLGADFPQAAIAEEGNTECWRINSDGTIYHPYVLPPSLHRLNPDVQTHNIAIPGATVSNFLNDTASTSVIQLLVLDPTGKWNYNASQPSVMAALKPSIIISTDLAGNNLLQWDNWADYKADYIEAIRLMHGTGADFYVANQPDVTRLPGFTDAYSQQTVNEIKSEIEAMNVEIKNIVENDYGGHVVDFYGAIQQWNNGVKVGGVTLNERYGGGLFSLDSLHLNSVGYAMIANLFIKKINSVYDCSYPEIDPAELLKTEPYSPLTINCNNSYNINAIRCEYVN